MNGHLAVAIQILERITPREWQELWGILLAKMKASPPKLRHETVPRLLLTKADAAKALNCSQRMIYNLIRCGDLPALRLGRLVRIELSALKEFVKRRRQGSAEGFAQRRAEYAAVHARRQAEKQVRRGANQVRGIAGGQAAQSGTEWKSGKRKQEISEMQGTPSGPPVLTPNSSPKAVDGDIFG